MSSAATVGVQRHLSHRCKPMLNRAGRSPSPSDVPLRCSARHIVPRRATHPVAQGMSLRFPSTRAGMLPLGSGSSLPGLTVSPAPLGACSYQINRSPDRPCFKPRTRTSPPCRGRSCWQRAAALQRARRKPGGIFQTTFTLLQSNDYRAANATRRAFSNKLQETLGDKK